MANFPVLRTGAVAQYPLDTTVRYATDAVRFVDGKEQRSRVFSQPLRRWTIALDLLDETELAAVESFFIAQAGSSGVFSFTDPGTGTAYANCSFENDELQWDLLGPGNGRVRVVVRENRG